MTIIIIISTLLGLIFAPLGCLVLWKRYVYFSDGLAHASMLAAVISVLSGLPIFYAGLINTLLFAFIVFKLKSKSDNNAAIGLTSSLMISLTLILSSIFPGAFNFSSMLFGDIILADLGDILALSLILIAVALFFFYFYHKLLLIILSNEVALSRGINTKILDLIFLGLLSFAVITTIKIVGALLVISLILIPAMISRIISTSPLMMLIMAMVFAQIMSASGMILSFYLDLPFAPIMILSGGVIFSLVSIYYRIIRRRY